MRHTIMAILGSHHFIDADETLHISIRVDHFEMLNYEMFREIGQYKLGAQLQYYTLVPYEHLNTSWQLNFGLVKFN